MRALQRPHKFSNDQKLRDNLTKKCTAGVWIFKTIALQNEKIFLPSMATFSSNLAILLDVVSSRKSVKKYSTHQNRRGETCCIVVTNFFSFSFRDQVSGIKFTEHSAK